MAKIKANGKQSAYLFKRQRDLKAEIQEPGKDESLMRKMPGAASARLRVTFILRGEFGQPGISLAPLNG